MEDNLKLSLLPKETLLIEGEDSNEMYYLSDGSLAVYKTQENGEELQIGTIYPGELVGELSFIDNLPRSATVVAISNSELVSIPRQKFEEYTVKQPRWYQVLIQTLSERLRKANSKIKI